MRRGNCRFAAEKTAVAAGYALTPRLRYGNVFSLLRLRFDGGGCGANGDTRFAKRTKFGGFSALTAQSGSVSVAIRIGTLSEAAETMACSVGELATITGRRSGR